MKRQKKYLYCKYVLKSIETNRTELQKRFNQLRIRIHIEKNEGKRKYESNILLT